VPAWALPVPVSDRLLTGLYIGPLIAQFSTAGACLNSAGTGQNRQNSCFASALVLSAGWGAWKAGREGEGRRRRTSHAAQRSKSGMVIDLKRGPQMGCTPHASQVIPWCTHCASSSAGAAACGVSSVLTASPPPPPCQPPVGPRGCCLFDDAPQQGRRALGTAAGARCDARRLAPPEGRRERLERPQGAAGPGR
jgi:hypothetical protein